MKTQTKLELIIVLLGIIFIVSGTHFASASFNNLLLDSLPPVSHLLAAPTPLPTAEPIVIASPTPEARILPPVGSNAGLVISASVLVLIIIAGVLSARARQKH